MSFSLDKVVPWGRTYEEYIAMFCLDEQDLQKEILGCGDGPASFNAEFSKHGGKIVSIDPIYQFAQDEIAQRTEEARHLIMAQIRANADEQVWGQGIDSPDHLEQIRVTARSVFLADYLQGKKAGRYIPAALPKLDFSDRKFGLALCSHFLLHYAEQLDLDFHLTSLRELCRVADEVRVFPILELGAKRSRHVDPVVARLSAEGYEVSIQRVGYEFIKGGNEMLIVKPSLRAITLLPQ